MELSLKKCVRDLYLGVFYAFCIIVLCIFMIGFISFLSDLIRNLPIITNDIRRIILKIMNYMQWFYQRYFTLDSLPPIIRFFPSLGMFILVLFKMFIPVFVTLFMQGNVSYGHGYGLLLYLYCLYCLGLVCTEFTFDGSIKSIGEFKVISGCVTIYTIIVVGIWAFEFDIATHTK